MSLSAQRAAYRAVLRLSRAADKRPELLVPLLGDPPSKSTARPVKGSAAKPAAPEHPLAADALSRACGGTLEYAHPRGLAAAAMRSHRRMVDLLGLDYLSDASEIIKRLRSARDVTEAVDVAAKAAPGKPKASQRQPKKATKSTWDEPGTATGDLPGFWDDGSDKPGCPLEASDPYEGDSTIWQHMSPIRFPEMEPSAPSEPCIRRFRATSQLEGLYHVPAWLSSPPQVGDFLLTHPLACRHQPTLDRVIVLVADVDESLGYVRGLVLGVPYGSSLKDTAYGRRTTREERNRLLELQELLDAPLLWGGDLRQRSEADSVTWLHTLGDQVSGAVEVAPSLWSGGCTSSLLQAVRSWNCSGRPGGLAAVQPIVGHLGWSKSQLDSELKSGHWIRIRLEDNARDAAWQLCMVRPQLGTSAAAAPRKSLERRAGEPAIGYRAALEAAGLHALASFPRGPNADTQIRKLVQPSFGLVGLAPQPTSRSAVAFTGKSSFLPRELRE
eukprot:TRINITY_DN90642_c0_g1_i1.p1 TRINITY_DN90642_c0_g1~~TRINITY_DN90642_c0_g1_i1.p1  ORF type:complete len:499 (-),score=59.51 TRINITY_DN90642_c0_g1_i1:86-1582(-)